MKNKIICKECGVNCERTSNNQRYCESCRKKRRIIKKREYDINWKINNPEKVKENNKKDSQKHKERKNKQQKKYIKKYPKKVIAHSKSNYYIKIPKGYLCIKCNKELATEKHHNDYNKPLNVIFLCKTCHTKIHRGGN